MIFDGLKLSGGECDFCVALVKALYLEKGVDVGELFIHNSIFCVVWRRRCRSACLVMNAKKFGELLEERALVGEAAVLWHRDRAVAESAHHLVRSLARSLLFDDLVDKTILFTLRSCEPRIRLHHSEHLVRGALAA